MGGLGGAGNMPAGMSEQEQAMVKMVRLSYPLIVASS
jgi:hypothetical protein